MKSKVVIAAVHIGQQVFPSVFLLLGAYSAEAHCNTFPMYTIDEPLQLRTNARHDHLVTIQQANAAELIAFIEQGVRGRDRLETKHTLSLRGIKGPCVLRSLAQFDVGSSFLVDTLHNVYLGAFVSVSPDEK